MLVRNRSDWRTQNNILRNTFILSESIDKRNIGKMGFGPKSESVVNYQLNEAYSIIEVLISVELLEKSI